MDETDEDLDDEESNTTVHKVDSKSNLLHLGLYSFKSTILDESEVECFSNSVQSLSISFSKGEL